MNVFFVKRIIQVAHLRVAHLPSRKVRIKLVAYLSSLVFLSACGKDEVDLRKFNLPDTVDYNYHIKPILSDSCFFCHGPDKPNAKAGLSLNTFQQATEQKLSSGNFAIVPGKPHASEAFQRISSDDPNVKMPPPQSNLALSPREKALLKKWITQGAHYKDHWAFISPEKTHTPTKTTWAHNDIDAFIQRAMQREGLSPSARADKESLIRRVSFDLTGLPPSIDSIDTFLADDSDTAYEELVDNLLNNPAFGERMASEWLDVARYADTHGYSVDRYRDVSPYRDWVIQSFNQNRPFNEFIRWQIAGDLLPNATQEQKLATAFNRIHAQNGEGGIVNEEFRVEYVKDRVQTLGTGLLGLTLHCAQCHDHKFDAISTKAYYQTFAMFNNVDESGQISWDANDTPGPTLLLPTEQQNTSLKIIDEKISSKLSALIQHRKQNALAVKQWINAQSSIKPNIKKGLIADYPLSRNDSETRITNSLHPKNIGIVRFGSDPNRKEGESMVHHLDASREAIVLNGDDQLFFASENHFNRGTPFTLAIDTLLPENAKDGVLIHYNRAAILFNFKGFEISLDEGYWHVRMAHAYPYNAISLKSKKTAEKNTWLSLALSYDGSSKASGLRFYVNGQALEMNIERDNLYKAFRHTSENVLNKMGLKVGARWRGRGISGALADNIKVWSRPLTALEITHYTGGNTAEQNAREVTDYYFHTQDTQYQNMLNELSALRKLHNAESESVQEMMIVQETEQARQAYILERGAYNNHGEAVEPGVPETIFPFDASWPRNRIGLANWLTDAKQPLVPRVLMNRYWKILMGKGIVLTPEDFGNQGALPTHPELLDWLSQEFIESGWNVKHMLKLIALSATYQQQSFTAENTNADEKALNTRREKDPNNTFYTRGPQQRLSAEMLRDNALTASGLLVKEIGGKSVYPYQPEGLWEMNEATYEQGTGEELYRRSLYTIWKRSVPPPSMHNFDTPTRSYSVGTRQETSTPLQALTLMNDTQYVEAARVLAERSMTQSDKPQVQIIYIFRALTSRHPTQEELAILKTMYHEFSARFLNNNKDASALLSVGESKPRTDFSAHKLAAQTSIANLILNHDATVIKR